MMGGAALKQDPPQRQESTRFTKPAHRPVEMQECYAIEAVQVMDDPDLPVDARSSIVIAGVSDQLHGALKVGHDLVVGRLSLSHEGEIGQRAAFERAVADIPVDGDCSPQAFVGVVVTSGEQVHAPEPVERCTLPISGAGLAKSLDGPSQDADPLISFVQGLGQSTEGMEQPRFAQGVVAGGRQGQATLDLRPCGVQPPSKDQSDSPQVVPLHPEFIGPGGLQNPLREAQAADDGGLGRKRGTAEQPGGVVTVDLLSSCEEVL
jgi:hypothetical protein